jgi:hypothetical protein
MAWCTPKYKKDFCKVAMDILAGGESLAAVCAEIEIARSTLYEWRDNHPEFAEAIQIGLQKAQRDWERLGRHGIQGDIEKFSASPWIFTMKNRFRDDYKDDSKEEKSTDTSVLEKILKGEITVNK